MVVCIYIYICGGFIEHDSFEKGNKAQDDDSSISSNNIVDEEKFDIIINDDVVEESNHKMTWKHMQHISILLKQMMS